MIEPKRLLEAEGTDIELRLLGAARDEAPSKALEARMRAGLGLPFAAPGPVSDFPPAVPSPTASTSGAAGASAQAASQAASQVAASHAASSAAASGAASAAAGTGFSWTTVLLGVALLGGFGAAAFSVASGDERDTATSGVVTARAPGEPGAPAAASPPPGATPPSATANNPSTTSDSDDARTGAANGANALADGSPSHTAHAANVDGATNAGIARGVTSSGASSPSGAARGATTGAGSTATGSSASSVAVATAPRATAVAAGAPSSSASRETALNEEIRLVDSMRSALAQGDGALALSRAATYRSRFPAGTLREEVEALRIEATRQSGDAKRADALAERFASEHPTSPHLGRVRGATSGTSTSPKR